MRGIGWMTLLGAAVAAGCVGEIGDGSGETGPGPGPQCLSTASPGAPVPMRRLTALHVERTVADVLGVDVKLAVGDEKLFTFKSNVSSSIDFAGAHGYLDFAEAAVFATDRSACAAADDACVAWLLDDVGRRLFRRTLSDDERQRYEALFEQGAAEDGGEEGARWVLEAMLQSPTFLYLDEVVDEDGFLDGTSIASRLALTIWGQNPDAALLDAAEAGELSTPEQITERANAMLDDPRSLGGLTDFVDQWFRLERLDDPDARPDLAALGVETIQAMRSEPVQLVRLLIDQDGDIATLLTTNETVATPELAEIYAGDVLSESGGRFMLDPEKRAGILSMPGVMAALAHAGATSPTLRGYNVLANLLCTPPNPPPVGVTVTLPDIGPGKTTRERLEAHFSDDSCAYCHAPMDGMGFAFESLDWLGRSREEEFGKPIDDTTSFPLDGVEVTVEGPSGLAAVTAESPDVASCVARQWVSYGGGIPDKDESVCLVEALAAGLREPGGLRAMIVEFVASDWFRRGPEEP